MKYLLLADDAYDVKVYKWIFFEEKYLKLKGLQTQHTEKLNVDVDTIMYLLNIIKQ
jgi:hypothetical protein